MSMTDKKSTAELIADIEVGDIVSFMTTNHPMNPDYEVIGRVERDAKGLHAGGRYLPHRNKVILIKKANQSDDDLRFSLRSEANRIRLMGSCIFCDLLEIAADRLAELEAENKLLRDVVTHGMTDRQLAAELSYLDGNGSRNWEHYREEADALRNTERPQALQPNPQMIGFDLGSPEGDKTAITIGQYTENGEVVIDAIQIHEPEGKSNG